MEEAGAGGGRRRLSLLEQMSAVDHTRDLAGLTLEAVLGSQKQPTNAVGHVNRTLLDIIRDEEPHGSLFGHKDKKTWKAFRDKLRLKRAVAAWISSVPIPASDVPIQSYSNFNSNNFHNPTRSLMSPRGSERLTTVSSVDTGDSTHSDDSNDQSAVSSSKPQMTLRTAFRHGLTNNTQSDSSRSDNSSLNSHVVGNEPPARSFRSQMSRHSLSRHIGDPVIESEEESTPAVGSRQLSVVLAEERSMSAREAVAAQEAAAAQQQSPEEANLTAIGRAAEEEPVRMSLMDLLEETDQQMGVVGPRYTIADDVACAGELDEEDEGPNGGDGIEHTCCVCMVRHKGAAFIPCGHTFCRLCSREVWVERGNCPLCNGYILEILDIF
ncbi:uncharacterized protein [Euphorbia lathyris]|uniref:uncharacterized protein n=1 Tax=Euphorbia lathyris TaxID=212925 RepID=UPI0033135995